MDSYSNFLYTLTMMGLDDIGNWETNSLDVFVDGRGPNLSLAYSSNAVEPFVSKGNKYISYTNRISLNTADTGGSRKLAPWDSGSMSVSVWTKIYKYGLL